MAAYCRVSTGSDEQLSSYHAQINYYENYIRSHPDYFFAGIYADEGISGTDLKKRDAFNRLMRDSRDGQIDMIITKSLSRFGRNTLDCLNCIRELKALRVDVYFEKENIHTMRSEGEMLLTLISAVAQSESLALSENVKWGIRKKYERGNIKSIPSGKFLGYDKDEAGNLIINEAQAKVVRRIYREFLDGYGTFQIAKRLTTEKVPMAYGGKDWCASHIRRVLTNEKMKGDTRFQKSYNADYLTKRRAKNNGELPQYYFENTHPAIIDKDTWACVQLEMKRQEQFAKHHYMNKFHRHCVENPLSGKIICQECAHTFLLRESNRKADYGKKYWVCSNYIKGRKEAVGVDTCRNGQRICAEVPEQAFVKAWNELADNKERFLPEWQQTINDDDILAAYRAKELMQQIEEVRCIEAMPYELMLKTLEYIEIGLNGKPMVVFLAETRI